MHDEGMHVLRCQCCVGLWSILLLKLKEGNVIRLTGSVFGVSLPPISPSSSRTSLEPTFGFSDLEKTVRTNTPQSATLTLAETPSSKLGPRSHVRWELCYDL